MLVVLLKVEIDNGVLEHAAQEELQGEIVDALWILNRDMLLSVIPGFNQPAPHGVCNGFIGRSVAEVEPVDPLGELQVLAELPLDGLLVGGNVGLHHFPELLSFREFFNIEGTRELRPEILSWVLHGKTMPRPVTDDIDSLV